MSYDEGLAERLREALQSQRGISEKKMFGGLAFMSPRSIKPERPSRPGYIVAGSQKGASNGTSPTGRPSRLSLTQP